MKPTRPTEGAYKLIDAELSEKIADRLEGSRRNSYLTAGVFICSFFALTAVASIHNEFRRTALIWTVVLWVVHLVWTIVAAVGWQTLSDEKFDALSEEERNHRFHLQTAWFHFWKVGLLLVFSTQVLLLGLGAFKYLTTSQWVDRIALGAYGLTWMLSLWQRHRICRVRIEGWSSETRWGRLMLRLATIGPAAAASTCSGIAVVVGRLRIVPESIAAGFIGGLGIVLPSLIIPQVVHDFLAAGVHWQVYKSEMEEYV